MSDNVEVKLNTTGMHCQSCSMLIKMNVEDLEGVASVESDYQSGLTTVSYDPGKVSPDDIVAEIVRSGYGAEVAE